MAALKLTLEQRFWAKVKKADGCWLWTGAGSRKGEHGRIGIGGRSEGIALAHRLSWELHHGPVPDGFCVCHRCDNPPCVNPAHLFLGTKGDNNRDMYAKGRAYAQSHGRNPLAKTHCLRGLHSFTPENTGWEHGRRFCIACAKARRERYQPIATAQMRIRRAMKREATR